MTLDRQRLIDHLTGIQSSKLTHYSDLKAHIAKVEQRNVQLEILNQIAKSIRVDMPVDEMMDGIQKNLARLIPSPRLHLHAPDSTELEAELAWVMEHRRTLVLETAVLIPLITRKAVTGILEIGSHDANALLSVGIPFLEQLGDQLASALANSHLYAEVLQRQQEWLLTFNAFQNPVLVVNREERILQCNDAAVRFPPTRGDTHAGKPWWRQVLGMVDVATPSVVDEAIKTGRSASARYQDQEGKLFDVNAYPLILEAGTAAGAIVHAKDVSDEVKYQAQLVQSARLAAIGQMAAGVAHELNSPLTVILGNTQLLQRALQSEGSVQPLLHGIFTSGSRCSRIIQDLLAFSRQDEYAFAPTDVNTVVQRVIALLHHSVERDGVQLEAHLTPDLPLIRANEYRIEQVVINLILNSRDAVVDQADPDRRLITVCTHVCDSQDGPRVAVTVRDQGSGIRPEHLSEIFQPFFTTKPTGMGTGLGLWVSLGIAREHEGTLEAESTWGLGSTFSLAIPAACEGGSQ